METTKNKTSLLKIYGTNYLSTQKSTNFRQDNKVGTFVQSQYLPNYIIF